MKRPRGFTLIELMITVAILAIVAAIAIPAYRDYVRDSRLGAMRMNLDTLRIAVEAYRLDSAAGNYGQQKEYAEDAIATSFGWVPEGDSDAYDYVVEVTAATRYSLCAASPIGLSIACRKGEGQFECTEGTQKTATATCP